MLCIKSSYFRSRTGRFVFPMFLRYVIHKIHLFQITYKEVCLYINYMLYIKSTCFRSRTRRSAFVTCLLYVIHNIHLFHIIDERSLCNVACSNYNCWNISSASNLFLPSWCWIILIKIISSERTIIDFCLSICFLLCPLFFPPNIFNRKEGFFSTCHWSE